MEWENLKEVEEGKWKMEMEENHQESSWGLENITIVNEEEGKRERARVDWLID